MNKLYIWGLAVIAVIAVIGLFSGGDTVVTKVTEQIVGSTPGIDFSQPCVTFGGVERCYVSTPWKVATSTTCAVRNPSSGTTTLAAFSFYSQSQMSSATPWQLGTTTLANALGGPDFPTTLISGTIGTGTRPYFATTFATGTVVSTNIVSTTTSQFGSGIVTPAKLQVGIGTATPTYLVFTMRPDASDAALRLNATTTGYCNFEFAK